MSQRSECLCAGLLEIFRRWGRAPAAMVLDNATEAGRMVRGEVTESRLFSQFRAHYRFESRYCNPYSGNEKGSVENAVGFLRRNLLVPVPAFGTLPELNAFLAGGCARINAAARCRDGRPHGEAYREDLAAMRALPGVEFDAVRWVTARADKRGYVEADGREYVAGPAWHGRSDLGAQLRGPEGPQIILSVVDLPAPLGPSRPYTSPSRMWRLTSVTASCAWSPRPKRLVSPRVSSM